MTLQSPVSGESLQLVDGNAEDLRRSALDLISSGEAMDRAANRLEDISEGTSDLKSEAIAKVRESAGEVFPDLRKAAVRYEGTGNALKKYAEALDKVQGVAGLTTSRGGVDNYASMGTLISDIETANETVESKRSQEDDAQGLVDEHNGFMGIGEGTDEQKESAKGDLSDATAAREAAEDELNKLWGKFDGRVSYWEDAFDTAVNEIEETFETADNHDKWYDHVGDILSIAGFVLLVVAIVATGPLAALAIALGTLVALASLGLEIYKMAFTDDGSWLNLGLAVIGFVPFGKLAGRLFKGARTIPAPAGIKSATGIVRNSVKGAVKKVYTKPTGGIVRRLGTHAKNVYEGFMHPIRQTRAADDFMRRFDDAFENRSYAKVLKDKFDFGLERKPNMAPTQALADFVKKNADSAGAQADDWADNVISSRPRDVFEGRIDFLSELGLKTYGAEGAVKNNAR